MCEKHAEATNATGYLQPFCQVPPKRLASLTYHSTHTFLQT